MAALDLLIDFATSFSPSPATLNLPDGYNEETCTVTIPSDPNTPHKGPLVVPDEKKQSCNPMTSGDRMSRQQNYPHAAASQCPSLEQNYKLRKYILEVQAALENCSLLCPLGRSYERHTNGPTCSIEAPPNYPGHQYTPPSTSLYASNKIIPAIDETWTPGPHFDGFYNPEQSRLFVPPQFTLYESPCRDARCSCQTLAPPFVNTINGHLPISHDAELSYVDVQDAGMHNSWLATSTTDDQYRLDWAQQYWRAN
jgi:hypothetical protein